MTIEFPCDHCGKPVRTPDSAAGKKGKCPHCEKVVRIPDASTAADSQPGSSATAPRVDQGKLVFACPDCSGAVRVPLASAGKKGKCPHCQHVLRIPEPATPAEGASKPPSAKKKDRIEFTCARCGEMVRTPAAAAGKKGQCPHCLAIFRIPQRSGEVARSAATEASQQAGAEPQAAPPQPDQDSGRIAFACHQCGERIKTPARLAGKKGKCPHCGAVVQIPGRAPVRPAPPTGPSPSRPQPAAASSSPNDELTLADEDDLNDDLKLVDDEPQPARPQSSGGLTPLDSGGGLTPIDSGGGLTPLDSGGGLTPIDSGGGLTPLDSGGGLTPIDSGGGLTPLDSGGGLTPLDSGGGLTPLGSGGGLTPLDSGGGLMPLGPAASDPFASNPYATPAPIPAPTRGGPAHRSRGRSGGGSGASTFADVAAWIHVATCGLGILVLIGTTIGFLISLGQLFELLDRVPPNRQGYLYGVLAGQVFGRILTLVCLGAGVNAGLKLWSRNSFSAVIMGAIFSGLCCPASFGLSFISGILVLVAANLEPVRRRFR